MMRAMSTCVSKRLDGLLIDNLNFDFNICVNLNFGIWVILKFHICVQCVYFKIQVSILYNFSNSNWDDLMYSLQCWRGCSRVTSIRFTCQFICWYKKIPSPPCSNYLHLHHHNPHRHHQHFKTIIILFNIINIIIITTIIVYDSYTHLLSLSYNNKANSANQK